MTYICRLEGCQTAQDLTDLCDACQAEYQAWADQATAETDWDDWADEMERLGLIDNQPPDFDPTYFDEWTLNESHRTRYLYGKPPDPPPVCTRCGRVTDPNDPEVRFKHGEVIACMQCTEPPKRVSNSRGSGERKTTREAAERYCKVYADAYILECGFAAYLYHKIGNCHQVVAEIPKGETADA